MTETLRRRLALPKPSPLLPAAVRDLFLCFKVLTFIQSKFFWECTVQIFLFSARFDKGQRAQAEVLRIACPLKLPDLIFKLLIPGSHLHRVQPHWVGLEHTNFFKASK